MDDVTTRRHILAATLSAETTGPDSVARNMIKEGLDAVCATTLAGCRVRRVIVPVPLDRSIAISSRDGDTTAARPRVQIEMAGERGSVFPRINLAPCLAGTDCRVRIDDR